MHALYARQVTWRIENSHSRVDHINAAVELQTLKDIHVGARDGCIEIGLIM